MIAKYDILVISNYIHVIYPIEIFFSYILDFILLCYPGISVTETRKWLDPFESVSRALRSQSVLSFLAVVIWFSPAINHNFIVVNALAGPVIKLSSELLNLVFFPRKRLNQY